jgi:hypothetical protein
MMPEPRLRPLVERFGAMLLEIPAFAGFYGSFENEGIHELPTAKFLHLAVGAATLPAVMRIANAQTYPKRSVTMVVTYPAGSGPMS